MPPKKDKDPNKPKGRMSAYAFFVQTRRAEKKEKGEEVQFTEFSKECSDLWKELDDPKNAKEKKRYYDMAEKDRIRHEREMASYKPPPGSKRGKGKKKQKDPNQPKRAKSAFFVFCGEERPKIKEENPGSTVGEIAKVLGARWQAMNDKQKKPYQNEAQVQREQYEKAMAEYRKNKGSSNAAVEAEVDDDEEDEEYTDED